jgi:hypothetical protein
LEVGYAQTGKTFHLIRVTVQAANVSFELMGGKAALLKRVRLVRLGAKFF